MRERRSLPRPARWTASLALTALAVAACTSSTQPVGNGATETEPARPAIGVTDDEILVAYYWRGDQTRDSQFFGDADILVPEEAEAFHAFIEYVNANSGTGAAFMGFPFDLHGRRIKGVILEGGRTPEQYSATAEKIAREIRPFATLSGEGSLSSYACPVLADAGILSVSTIALEPNMHERHNGYCLPMHMAWETQVDLVVSFLTEHAQTPFDGPESEAPRVYGIAHTEHPGLLEAIPQLVQLLENAGVTVGATGTLPVDLTVAQQQTGNLVSRFRSAGVNTVIMPDAGAALTLPRGAQAQAWEVDYVVWPCSGTDLAGMGRLIERTQWTRAEGLTCYDAEMNIDIQRDEFAETTEWFQQFKAAAGEDEDPPLNTELVYLTMLPLLVGITNAGPDLTPDTFLAGLSQFEPYRYSASQGRTDNPDSLLLELSGPYRSPLGDAARIRWDLERVFPGSPLPGGFEFLAGGRLAPSG